MIAKNWLKWTAGPVTAAIVLVAMPAIGQARTYTGRTPSSIASSTTGRHAVKLMSKHKKHMKHAKHHQLSSKHHQLTSKHHHASKAAKIKA